MLLILVVIKHCASNVRLTLPDIYTHIVDMDIQRHLYQNHSPNNQNQTKAMMVHSAYYCQIIQTQFQ